jgi:mono/diheme cytochrome c family protein
MTRSIRVLSLLLISVAAAALLGACGTEKIKVASSSPFHNGAVLFSQRCSGCHTLAYAGTHGSAANVRTAMQNNGPNFDVRCERPITRVLYAIENGGFSGAIMPQNIVVGADAKAVAGFVSEYAGRSAPKIVGQTPCESQPIGTLPTPGQLATAATKTSGPGAQRLVGQGTAVTKAPTTRRGVNPATNAGTQAKTGVKLGSGTSNSTGTSAKHTKKK